MTNIVLCGDTHGDFLTLEEARKSYPNDVIIQVGDFGFWPYMRNLWKGINPPIYFIEGNHDFLPELIGIEKPTEVWPGAIYVPRGTVLELAGMRVGFLGGATSIDRPLRVKNDRKNGWYEEEDVQDRDIDLLLSNNPDIVVAHTPPKNMINRNFVSSDLIAINYGHFTDKFIDISAERVDRVVATGKPYYCGHMHKSVVDNNVRILNINEIHVIGGR